MINPELKMADSETQQPQVVFISPDEVLKDLCDKDPTV